MRGSLFHGDYITYMEPGWLYGMICIISMDILGISAFYHDSAACLVRDGKIIAAAQEERFTRKKNDDRYPKHAIDYCLSVGRIAANQLDYVTFYEKGMRRISVQFRYGSKRSCG